MSVVATAGKATTSSSFTSVVVCSHCKKPGHSKDKCWFKYPRLRPNAFRPRPKDQQAQLSAAAIAPSPPILQVGSAATQPSTSANFAAPATAQISIVRFIEDRKDASTSCILAGVPTVTATQPIMPADSKCVPKTYCCCPLQLEALHEGKRLTLLIDTGANVSLMHQKFITDMHAVRSTSPLVIVDANEGTCSYDKQVTVTLDIQGHLYTFDFYVTASLPADALLGLDAIVSAG